MTSLLNKLKRGSQDVLRYSFCLTVWPNSASIARLFDQLLLRRICAKRNGEETVAGFSPRMREESFSRMTAAGKLSRSCLPILLCVCSHVLSHSAAPFCRLAPSPFLSPRITCHSAVSWYVCICVCGCVCVCVLNLSLSVLWSPCTNRFGWSLLVVHVCVSVMVCVCVCEWGRCSPGGGIAQRSHTPH